MKKRSHSRRRVVARKKTYRSVSKTRSPLTLSFGRIIIVSTIAVVLFFAFVMPNKRTLTQSVAGISIVKPLFTQALITWESVPEATTYNLYYKQESDPDFVHAVRNISADHTYYTISYLRKGLAYQYRISALDLRGEEFWWSDILPISNIQPM